MPAHNDFLKFLQLYACSFTGTIFIFGMHFLFNTSDLTWKLTKDEELQDRKRKSKVTSRSLGPLDFDKVGNETENSWSNSGSKSE